MEQLFGFTVLQKIYNSMVALFSLKIRQKKYFSSEFFSDRVTKVSEKLESSQQPNLILYFCFVLRGS